MNSNRLTVMIDGREALTIRAIPYTTNWNNFAPDMLAWYLGEDDKRFTAKTLPLIPLTAYRMEGGQPVAIEPSAWATVADKLKNTNDKSQFAVVSCLPAEVFVWLDDFQRVWNAWREVPQFDRVTESFKKLWFTRCHEEYPDEDEKTDAERTHARYVPAEADDELIMSPTLLDGAIRSMLMEGFEKFSDAVHEAGAGITEKESPQERRTRLRDRCATLKREGVKGWQSQAASEEGITATRLRAMLSEGNASKETGGKIAHWYTGSNPLRGK